MLKVLIAGASRGIGLGLTRAFLERGAHVHAVIRSNPNAALEQLKQQHAARLSLIVCDMTRDDAPPQVRSSIADQLDIAVFNAGVSTDASIESVSREELATLFLSNAIAPLRMARALSPAMTENSVIAFMSSQMGSVELARASSMPLYGASKAALNSLVRSWSEADDKPNGCLLALHPGWVKTDMGGDDAPLTVDGSVAGLTETLLDHQGRTGCHFRDYTNQPMPW
jgi:NAD(P)-dependent dehydrogenase (short-subunit alcohol dehydrogenase family)